MNHMEPTDYIRSRLMPDEEFLIEYEIIRSAFEDSERLKQFQIGRGLDRLVALSNEVTAREFLSQARRKPC